MAMNVNPQYRKAFVKNMEYGPAKDGASDLKVYRKEKVTEQSPSSSNSSN